MENIEENNESTDSPSIQVEDLFKLYKINSNYEKSQLETKIYELQYSNTVMALYIKYKVNPDTHKIDANTGKIVPK